MKNYNNHKKIAYRKKNKTKRIPIPCSEWKVRWREMWGSKDGSKSIKFGLKSIECWIDYFTTQLDNKCNEIPLRRLRIKKSICIRHKRREYILISLKIAKIRHKRIWLRVFGV